MFHQVCPLHSKYSYTRNGTVLPLLVHRLEGAGTGIIEGILCPSTTGNAAAVILTKSHEQIIVLIDIDP
jgi:hypothetical protein